MVSNGSHGRETLMTRTSVALALAPPRSPPHDSAHRMLLLAQDPSEAAIAHHHTQKESDSHHHHGISRHAMQLLRRYHLNSLRLPHPHLPAGPELGDQVTRALGTVLPLSMQNRWRKSCRRRIRNLMNITCILKLLLCTGDYYVKEFTYFCILMLQIGDSGVFRSIADTMVAVSAPTLAVSNPSAALQFLKLTKRCIHIRYGQHRMHVIDMFFPSRESGVPLKEKPRGLIFFVVRQKY